MTDSDHTPSPTHCISCGTEVPDHAKFCHACGAIVYRPEDKNQLSEPALAEPPVPETSADTDPIGEVLPESAEPESLVPGTSTDRVAHELHQNVRPDFFEKSTWLRIGLSVWTMVRLLQK